MTLQEREWPTQIVTIPTMTSSASSALLSVPGNSWTQTVSCHSFWTHTWELLVNPLEMLLLPHYHLCSCLQHSLFPTSLHHLLSLLQHWRLSEQTASLVALWYLPHQLKLIRKQITQSTANSSKRSSLRFRGAAFGGLSSGVGDFLHTRHSVLLGHYQVTELVTFTFVLLEVVAQIQFHQCSRTLQHSNTIRRE